MAGTNRIDFFSNAAAGNSASFTWIGGWLAFYAEATGAGTVLLQILSPKGTWITIPNSTISTTGSIVNLQLPPGQLRAVGAGFTAIYASAFSLPTMTTR